MKYRIKIIKTGRSPRYMYDVKSVSVDKKHRYFIVTSKIYHHDIIQIIRFDECDYIEVYTMDHSYGMFINDKPIKVVNQE